MALTVEVLESLKGWIIDPDTQAQKTIENYENQRLSIEDAIESGLLNNRAGQIFLDYGDIVMGPAVKTPADIIVIRETVKGNSDSKEMQRTATAGFYAGFVGQGIEYTQIISNADYQLSMIITSAKGVNSINNPLSYLLFIKDFSLTQTIDAAKAGLQDAWNGTYDSAIGRKIGAGTFNYLLMTIGGALLKGKGNACEAVESGSVTKPNQVHHYATNKSKTYTPQLEEIANRYELDLDDAWNKDLLPHQGRHPNAYHEYVLDSMKQFDNIAQGDKDIFLKLFDNLKNNVKSKPDMLYKDYWK